jgi:hypothetical protein
MKTITFENFEETYKPIKNPFVQDSSYDGCMFETYGVELAHVKEQDNKNIWTIINCENEESWIIPGFHFVNCFGYFITEIPWESEDIQVNDNEMCTIEEAIDYCMDFGEETFKIAFDKNDVTLHFNENLDSTFDGEMTTGRAKYIAIDYFEDRLEKDMGEFEDEIHNYYSQL